MNLQEKHLEAIENNIPIEGSLYSDAEKAAEASAQITKDYMKRFAEFTQLFCWTFHAYHGVWIDKNGVRKTIDELIEIFLQNENPKP